MHVIANFVASSSSDSPNDNARIDIDISCLSTAFRLLVIYGTSFIFQVYTQVSYLVT